MWCVMLWCFDHEGCYSVWCCGVLIMKGDVVLWWFDREW